MLPTSVHLLLAGVMVLAGGAAAWLMLEMYGERTPAAACPGRTRLHRGLGRTFGLVYLVLLVSMLWRAREVTSWGPVQALHATLGLALLPLLAIKVGIARRWRPLQRYLPLVGSLVFVVAFTTAALGVLPRLHAASGLGSLPSTGPLADHPGKLALETHCVKCHTLARPIDKARAARPNAAEWLLTIATMRSRAAQRGVTGWSDEESRQIADFLAQLGAGGGGAAPAVDPGVGGPGAGDDHGRGRGRGGR